MASKRRNILFQGEVGRLDANSAPGNALCVSTMSCMRGPPEPVFGSFCPDLATPVTWFGSLPSIGTKWFVDRCPGLLIVQRSSGWALLGSVGPLLLSTSGLLLGVARPGRPLTISLPCGSTPGLFCTLCKWPPFGNPPHILPTSSTLMRETPRLRARRWRAALTVRGGEGGVPPPACTLQHSDTQHRYVGPAHRPPRTTRPQEPSHSRKTSPVRADNTSSPMWVVHARAGIVVTERVLGLTECQPVPHPPATSLPVTRRMTSYARAPTSDLPILGPQADQGSLKRQGRPQDGEMVALHHWRPLLKGRQFGILADRKSTTPSFRQPHATPTRRAGIDLARLLQDPKHPATEGLNLLSARGRPPGVADSWSCGRRGGEGGGGCSSARGGEGGAGGPSSPPPYRPHTRAPEPKATTDKQQNHTRPRTLPTGARSRRPPGDGPPAMGGLVGARVPGRPARWPHTAGLGGGAGEGALPSPSRPVRADLHLTARRQQPPPCIPVGRPHH
ncbi:hypothetical protein AAG570_004909 [Ranatra chinensis]|uniref:Uncharacterized protein n=1 Tax=Ranatra chinensis TaxID=642074 RepID=A0ABD0YMH6_9HEMI